MTQKTNQFNQSVEAGQIGLNAIEGRTIEVYIDDSYSGTGIKAGSVVKLQPTSTGPEIVVNQKTDAAEVGLGIVAFSVKKTNYKAGDYCEVYVDGKVVFAKVGEAVNAGVELTWDNSNGYFVAKTTGNVDAISLDKVAAGDIGRVIVKSIM